VVGLAPGRPVCGGAPGVPLRFPHDDPNPARLLGLLANNPEGAFPFMF